MRGLRAFKMYMATSTDKIIFFGSGKVAEPSLKAIIKKFMNVHVVTHLTKDSRKITNEVQLLCQKQNIPYSTPITDHNDKLKRKQQWEIFKTRAEPSKLAVICSYGFMIPSSVIDLFMEGGIVIHPSILPKFRGGAPILHAIVNGEQQSGVSYIQISKNKFDEGNILFQIKCNLDSKMYYSEIEKQLADLAGTHIVNVIQNFTALKPGIPQSSLLTSINPQLIKAPIVRTKKLSFHEESKKVYNWSRALQIPRVTFRGNQIIVNFEDEYMEGQGEIGDLKLIGKKIYVRCKDKYIRLKSWKQISKKQLPMYTFIDRFMKKQTDEPKPNDYKLL